VSNFFDVKVVVVVLTHPCGFLYISDGTVSQATNRLNLISFWFWFDERKLVERTGQAITPRTAVQAIKEHVIHDRDSGCHEGGNKFVFIFGLHQWAALRIS
jgi:hypothetical protein